MTQYDDQSDTTAAVKLTSPPAMPRPGRGRSNFLDDIANDLAIWIDQTATEVALAFAPARAPFSANITEQQKLEFYKTRIFNPDGSPNGPGRKQEIDRLGAEGFGHVYEAVVRRWPELKPPEEPPVEVPPWPTAPAGLPGPSAMPPGLPPGPPGLPPGRPGPPGLPPSMPMMPPMVAR